MKIYDFNGQKNICGKQIREARFKQRLTQTDLAARIQVLGVNLERNGISKIESGIRFVADYELRAIAQALHVDVAWLLSGDDEKDEK